MVKIKKKLKKLKYEFDYYHRKVEDMETERDEDRSWEGKALLKKFKKIKLALKTEIENFSKKID
jgi:hypothetical protein|tara:strand:- start:6767 stop:6958 length:192 start_codon:yes stop_codon:yes gene_type:complete